MNRLTLLLLIFFVSCSSKDRVPDFDPTLVSSYDIEAFEEEAEINITDLYELRTFKELVIAMQLSGVDDNELDQYQENVNNFFEKVSNRSSKEFYLENSEIKINMTIMNSFEILNQGLFCREYSQVIDFRVASISMTGVACRGSKGWNILKKIK
ncbi:MAG: hypothetical protein HOM96_02190 [Rickettsiales bacterium]|jgi:hypothetical protein|nr:hypothetical protein [Rickettsiales bacterium]